MFFHTDQSNNDWGFKLTSSACVSAPEELDEAKSEVRKNAQILNFFFGDVCMGPQSEVLGRKTMFACR